MVSARPAVALTSAVLLIAVLLSGSSGGGGASALTAFGKPLPGCPPEKFDCQNGKCISGSRWCDGIDNCGNNADELSCRICLSGSLKCKGSNQCVPSGARCNGQIECQDKSDELGCETVVTEAATTVSSYSKPQEVTNRASNNLISDTILLVTLVYFTI